MAETSGRDYPSDQADKTIQSEVGRLSWRPHRSPQRPCDANAAQVQNDRSTVVRGFGIIGVVGLCYIGLLALLGKPMMFDDPLFGFCLGLKLTEEVRRLSGHANLTRQ